MPKSKLNRKPTPVQESVLALMRDGWQLGHSTTRGGYYWLQKGGCGRGGESRGINANTVYGLKERGLIVEDESNFPLETYKLTEG